MEKFGEWEHIVQVSKGTEKKLFSYEIDIQKPNYYQVAKNYARDGRMVWRAKIELLPVFIHQKSDKSSHGLKGKQS